MKPRLKRVVLLLVVLGIAGTAGYFTLGRNDKPNGSTDQTQSQNQDTAQGGDQTQADNPQQTNTQSPNFTYLQPKGWAKLSQDFLTTSKALSGIGRGSEPFGTFMVMISDEAPANKDLRRSTLDGLERLTNFKLISSTSAKVDGKDGLKFTYTYGNIEKVKQETYVVVNNDKAFVLQFSSAEGDFSKNSEDFGKIFDSFKFK